MTDNALPLVRVISFGFGHTGALDDDGETVLAPPEADIVLDLRRTLRNPHHDPAMRYLTGLDQVVYDHVLATPGAQTLAHNTAFMAHILLTQARVPALTIGSGCAGGRHRAVGIAREVHRLLVELAAAGPYRVDLVHRDVHRDVLPATKHAAAG